MHAKQNTLIPDFDFTEAFKLPLSDRFQTCVDSVRSFLGECFNLFDPLPIPQQGASETELRSLESRLGRALPPEYRLFLGQWRYLTISDGCTIWGLGGEEGNIGSPWVSEDHRPGSRVLVLGDYWQYADGDQLVVDLEDSAFPIGVYLHERDGRIEYFAPTFSTALWRLVFEK